MHLLKYRLTKRQLDVLKNRKELIKGGISRRDLLKLGLMTSAGVLVDGLSVSRAFGQTTATTVDANGTITGVARSSSQSCGSRGSSLCVNNPPSQAVFDFLPTPPAGASRNHAPPAPRPAPPGAPDTGAGRRPTSGDPALPQ